MQGELSAAVEQLRKWNRREQLLTLEESVFRCLSLRGFPATPNLGARENHVIHEPTKLRQAIDSRTYVGSTIYGQAQKWRKQSSNLGVISCRCARRLVSRADGIRGEFRVLRLLARLPGG